MSSTVVIPPLEGQMKLPSMLTLYKRDWITLSPDAMDIRLCHCIDIPPKIACAICRHFPKMREYVMDFIQEGNIALLESHAQCPSDWSLTSFRAYVAAKAKGHVVEYMSQTNGISIPRTPRLTMIKKGQREEIDTLENHLSWELLLESINVDEGDIPIVQHATWNNMAILRVESMLDRLPKKEAQCLLLYFGIGINVHSTQEIADLFHITPHNANFLVNAAMRRIRGEIGSRSKEFIDRDRMCRLESVYSTNPHVSVSELKHFAQCGYTHAKAFLKNKVEECR